jgi:HK97 family phage major capsid protein
MKLKKMFRAISAEGVEIDVEKRTASFSFSSEHPVERYFGTEILSHEAGAMDLSRVKAGATPLLWNHDPDQPIGMVKTAKIESGRGVAIAEFFSTPFAQEKLQQMNEGLRNISFGYQPEEMELTKTADKGKSAEYTVTRYGIFEMSLVSIPADPTVGVGRSDKDSEFEVQVINHQTNEGVRNMNEAEQKALEAKIRADMEKNNIDGIKAERDRAATITALGDKYGMGDLSREFVNNGKSVDEARQAILERMGTKQKPVTGQEGVVGLTEKEMNDFSFVRALAALTNPHDRAIQEAAKFEFECSRAAEKKSGKTSRGIMVPYDVLRHSKRDLTVGSSTAGGHLVGTDFMASSFIEILRIKSVMARAGAMTLNGLVGNIAIPRQTGAATVYHVGENAAPTEGAIAFDQVTMSPKTIAAYIDYSRKLLIQGSPDIDGLVKADLASGLALGIDNKALYGSGSANQPTGLQSTSGLNLVEFTSNAPTWAEIVDLETQVAADNADIGSMKYLMNALGRGVLKTTEKASSTGQFIFDKGEVNGYAAEVSNQVSRVSTGKEHYWFGVWNQLMIGFWSGLDLLADPYTGSKEGTIRVVAMQDYDIGVRHPEAFGLGYNS